MSDSKLKSMGSNPNQGFGWVQVRARAFKSQSEVHGFKGTGLESFTDSGAKSVGWSISYTGKQEL